MLSKAEILLGDIQMNERKLFRIEAKLDLMLGLLVEMNDKIPRTNAVDTMDWDINRNRITKLLLEDKLDGVYLGD